MKILLLSPPFLDTYNQIGCIKKDGYSPPLGLGYIAASLKNEGCSTKIIDFMHRTLDEAAAVVTSETPDVVGISCFTEQRTSVFRLAEKIKHQNKKVKIVLGGSHATMLDTQIMQHLPIDAIVRGEGEITFLELIRRWESGDMPADIQGLTYRDKMGKIVKNEDRPPIENLDSLPFPEYEYFDWSLYKQPPVTFRGKDVNEFTWASLITTRGCPYCCQYCSTTRFWGKRYRTNSAEVVVEKIESLHRDHGVEFINFVDDEFIASRSRAVKICEQLIERDINIGWTSSARVDSVDHEVLSLMKKAGCVGITFGVESGSEIILRAINKRITVGDIYRATELSREAQIQFSFGLMVGNPGETRQTVNQTIELLHKVKPLGGAAFPTTVFPGTDLYETYRSQGLVDESYWLSNKAAPIFDVENNVEQIEQWAEAINFHLMTSQCIRNQRIKNTNTSPVLLVGNDQMGQIRNLLKAFLCAFEKIELTVICQTNHESVLQDEAGDNALLTFIPTTDCSEIYPAAIKALQKRGFDLLLFIDQPKLQELTLLQLLTLSWKAKKVVASMPNGVLVPLPKARLLRRWIAQKFVPLEIRESQFFTYLRRHIG